MRRYVLFAALAACSIQICIAGKARAADIKSTPRTPVLVELFTSEGCSSCPPADALLAQLLNEQPVDSAQIIVLGEHVDYWDSLGWHDRFSSAQFTARQSQYSTRFHLDSIYTPQMVVDGAAQFTGNDSAQAHRSIGEAARIMKLPISLSPLKLDGRIFSATVSGPAGAPAPKADLYAALVDPMDSTDVHNGENGGRTLHHVSVVRTLARIGSASDLAGGPVTFSITAPPASNPAKMQLVVFAQPPSLGPVLAIAMASR